MFFLAERRRKEEKKNREKFISRVQNLASNEVGKKFLAHPERFSSAPDKKE